MGKPGHKPGRMLSLLPPCGACGAWRQEMPRSNRCRRCAHAAIRLFKLQRHPGPGDRGTWSLKVQNRAAWYSTCAAV